MKFFSEKLRPFFNSKREKIIMACGALIMMPPTLYIEANMTGFLAKMDPDLFGPTIEHVIESQNKNFKDIRNDLNKLSSISFNDEKANQSILSLSNSVKSALKTNKELTGKLNSLAKDRETLIAELIRTKGGNSMPSILIKENQSIKFKDLGIVGISKYSPNNHNLTMSFNGKRKSYVIAGDGFKVKNKNGIECNIVYMGEYDGKFGLGKSCL